MCMSFPIPVAMSGLSITTVTRVGMCVSLVPCSIEQLNFLMKNITGFLFIRYSARNRK